MRSMLSMTCWRSLRLAAPPGGDVGQQQLLAAAARAQSSRQEGEQGAGFEDARAERIDHRDRAVAQRLDHARRADLRLRVELERIGEGGIQAAPQHADRLQAGDGAHHHLPSDDGEVLALEQHEAEIAGDIGVLEIGLVELAGRQDGDAARSARAPCRAARRGSRGRSRPADGRASRHRCRRARASWRRGSRARSRRPTAPACGRPAPTSRRPGRGRARRRRNAGNVRWPA